MWFKKKSLEHHLQAKKKVTIKGIEFIIQRIRLLDYLSGAKVMTQTFDTYKTASIDGGKELPTSFKKIEEHFADVLIAGVVSPRISRTQGESPICIEDMFKDWEMCSELYEAIMEFTNGKKKI
jgi:hypothetical protein